MVRRKLKEFLPEEDPAVSNCEWGEGSRRRVTENLPGAAAPKRASFNKNGLSSQSSGISMWVEI